MILICILCATLILPGVMTEDNFERTAIEGQGSKWTLGWIEDGAYSLLDSILPDYRENPVEVGRKKKKKKYNKYVLPLIVGYLLIKSILLPIALKGLAVLSGKAVILSLMSLILAAIVGLKKVAQSSSGSNYDLVNVPLSKYRRDDEFYRRNDPEDDTPYRFYRDRRRTK